MVDCNCSTLSRGQLSTPPSHPPQKDSNFFRRLPAELLPGRYFNRGEKKFHFYLSLSFNPWNCWRTWELHSVPRTCFNASFSHCLSFSPTPVIACHSPPLSVGVLLSDSILDATAAFLTICCTLPSHCSHQILVLIDSRVEYQQSSSQNGTKDAPLDYLLLLSIIKFISKLLNHNSLHCL